MKGHQKQSHHFGGSLRPKWTIPKWLPWATGQLVHQDGLPFGIFFNPPKGSQKIPILVSGRSGKDPRLSDGADSGKFELPARKGKKRQTQRKERSKNNHGLPLASHGTLNNTGSLHLRGFICPFSHFKLALGFSSPLFPFILARLGLPLGCGTGAPRHPRHARHARHARCTTA